MHPLVQTPWNCSLPHPSKRCCILVSGRCHNEKEGSSPARLNPSLPNPGYSLGTWNSPPAVRLWDLLPSPAYPQFKRDKSPLLIHQIPHGREKQCRRSLLLSRATWDKLAQGSKVSLRCPGWRKRISFIHRQHSGHQPQRLSQTFSRQSSVLPLSISSSLSISRWPRQFCFQIKTNRKLATRLRSAPLPPAKFLPATQGFLGQLSVSRHENRAGIESLTARQWARGAQCARPAGIRDICHGALQTDSFGWHMKISSNSPIWQGVEIRNGAFLIWKSPRQRMSIACLTRLWRLEGLRIQSFEHGWSSPRHMSSRPMVYDRGSPAPCSDSGLRCWSWDQTSAGARLREPDTFASQVEDGALRLPRDTARTLWSWLPTQCPSHSWTSWFLSTDFRARNALQSRNPEELRQTPVIDNTSALICLLFCTVTNRGSVLSPLQQLPPFARETVPPCHPQHKWKGQRKAS